MARVIFQLNEAGVRELLQSPEIASAVAEYTAQVASRAGVGYSGDVKTGMRAVGRVTAVTEEAKLDNEQNNTLLKALNG